MSLALARRFVRDMIIRSNPQRKPAYEPTCFGSNPSYQEQAENGCATCQLNSRCLSPLVTNTRVITPKAQATKVLTITRDGDTFVTDDTSRPGSPPIGQGRTIYESLGRWLHANREYAGITINLDESAAPFEAQRRTEELSER